MLAHIYALVLLLHVQAYSRQHCSQHPINLFVTKEEIICGVTMVISELRSLFEYVYKNRKLGRGRDWTLRAIMCHYVARLLSITRCNNENSRT